MGIPTKQTMKAIVENTMDDHKNVGLAVVELYEYIEELRQALEDAITVIEHGDFKNGNTAYGIDEGESMAYGMVDRIRNVLR